jgi:hypothetical protein
MRAAVINAAVGYQHHMPETKAPLQLVDPVALVVPASR